MTAAAPLSRSTKVARAAPRESASMPAAPEPANRSRNAGTAQVRLEDGEERLLDPVGERPRARAGCLEPDPPRRPGDDPAGVRPARHAPLAGSPAATRRSQPRVELGGQRRPWRRHPPVGVEQRLGVRRGHGPRGRDAPRPGATRRAAAGSRSGRDRGRRPPCAARSPSRPARSRRASRRRPRRRASATSSVDSETRTQNDSTVPRPTRPRSWWSWASPNRSAPSMTIIVAAGTSTPTSTTVVPTRTSSSPSRKRVISASRSAGLSRPWTIPTRSGSSSAASRTASLSAATAPSPSSAPSSMSGTTTNVRWPSAASSRTFRHVPSRSAGRLDPGPDLDPAGRRRPQVGDVEVGVEHLAERPRDRRRGHQQDVRRAAAGLRLERAALVDPEAVLLVDDDEPEVGERDRVLDERVRADDDQRLARRDRLERLGLDVGLERAGQERHADPELVEQRADGLEVLAGEQVGRGEQGALEPGPRGRGEGIGRDRGLARADVALEEPQHRGRPGEVVADGVDRRRPGRRSARSAAPIRAPIASASAARTATSGALDRPAPPAPHRGPAGGGARPSRAGAPGARRTRAGGAPRRGPRRSPGSGPPRSPAAIGTSPSSAMISAGRYSGYAKPALSSASRMADRRRTAVSPAVSAVDRHDPAGVEQLGVARRRPGTRGCRGSGGARNA